MGAERLLARRAGSVRFREVAGRAYPRAARVTNRAPAELNARQRMVVLSPQAQAHTSAEAALEVLDVVRTRTNALIASISDRDLERSHSPLMSPLVWDLGRIAAYEDL